MQTVLEQVPLEEVPEGLSILPFDIQLKLKRNEENSVNQHKSRVCVGGQKKV